jgi:hypothetical protein
MSWDTILIFTGMLCGAYWAITQSDSNCADRTRMNLSDRSDCDGGSLHYGRTLDIIRFTGSRVSTIDTNSQFYSQARWV